MAKKSTKGRSVLLILEPETKKKLLIIANQQKTSMQCLIEGMVEDYIENQLVTDDLLAKKGLEDESQC